MWVCQKQRGEDVSDKDTNTAVPRPVTTERVKNLRSHLRGKQIKLIKIQAMRSRDTTTSLYDVNNRAYPCFTSVKGKCIRN